MTPIVQTQFMEELLQVLKETFDWDEGWRIKNVSSAVWNDLRRDVRRGYRTAVEHLRGFVSLL